MELLCADTCYTDATGRITQRLSHMDLAKMWVLGNVNTSYFHPSINDSLTVAKQIVIGTESAVGSCAYLEIPSSSPSEIVVKICVWNRVHRYQSGSV